MRHTIRFALGGLIGVAAWLATMFGHVLGSAALLLPCFGFFVGGAVAGTGLKHSIGAVFGFGLAFVIGNFVGIASLVATQAMTGRERLLFGYVLTYSIGFAVAGWLGLSGADVRGRPRVIGVLGFSVGGCGTALLVVGLLTLRLIGGSPLNVAVGYAIPLTLPWLIGGFAIDKAAIQSAAVLPA